MRTFLSFMIFLVSIAISAIAIAGGPPTEDIINASGEGFSGCSTQFVDPGEVVFIEINYDGVSPITINTSLTTDSIDTELGLYDANGEIVATNDDINFPADLLSEIRLDSLPAGEYFLGVGLFNTIYNPGFDATSNATASGNVVIKVQTDLLPALDGIVNVELNYNFNGIVHADEPADPINDPDAPDGFRSISDRALDFRNGIPSDATLNRYILAPSGGELDIVHLGNRNTVAGGIWAFDDEADFDGVGIQPDWLPDPDQTGRQTTVLLQPIPMNNNSQVQLLFQISNGGGAFDVVVGFDDGSEAVGTVVGPDWFGPFNGQPNIGIYDGAHGTDFAFMDPLGENTLLITEAVVGLGDFDGLEATSVAFENASNANGGIAIIAANFAGLPGDDCMIGDVNGDGAVDLLDVGPFVDLLTASGYSCEADVNQDGALDLLDVGPFVDLLTGG